MILYQLGFFVSKILRNMAEQVQKQNHYILYNSSNGIATIALNRPEAANAQNLALLYQV